MDGPIPSPGPHFGRVTSYDVTRGLGAVTDLATGTEYPFHATAIADDSRSIAEQAAVIFTVVPGHGGRYEAQSIETVDATRFLEASTD